ncbi:MAG: PAS domain-containing sensor histidine kinase, partial [Candidatus Saccharibacteria bacterium]|nr:PAS domain-containing sensor histidine kinase [Candidatus Saccharibacteria bacterium]
MSFFRRKKQQESVASVDGSNSPLAEMVLATIHDGVIITDVKSATKFINPAAATIIGLDSPKDAIGLDFGLLFKIESKDGRPFDDNDNPLIKAIRSNEQSNQFIAYLVSASNKRTPVAFSVFPANSSDYGHIITFRDVTKELAEESEQAEFISTASHEMRTPIASIEGYLSLALNPQTATIDERARKYLESAHTAAEHLGHLFRDLLDVTKLDDGRIKPHLKPVEITEAVRQIADAHAVAAKEAKLNYQFGASKLKLADSRRMNPLVYGYVDIDFLREIVDNLIDNAIKYTPSGGSIYVNVLGDGDRAIINVTDTGIGISPDDITHIFQKFYRADNSDTRTIGGTGLGLYIVKQRVEALGGRVWAESSFGEGTTFFVSLPRISSSDYEKLLLAMKNNEAMNMASTLQSPAPAPASHTPISTPVPTWSS